MVSNDDDGLDEDFESRLEDDESDSDASSSAAVDRASVNKNETRSRRLKLREMAPILGLEEDEISALAAAGMMMPDAFKMLLQSDLMKRIEGAEVDARYRVQYTGMLVPPKSIDDLVGDDPKPVRIGSKSYLKVERSISKLMVAVRGNAKAMGVFAGAYAEHYHLQEELLRLVQERLVTARMMRHSVPEYLVEFARLMESLGCKRNDLRYVDGGVVRAVREALKLVGEEVDRGADEEARRFKLWLLEHDAAAGPQADEEVSVDEFDRLSRVAAKALMDGDLEAARVAFAAVEAFDASLEEAFGLPVEDSTDQDEVAEASPVGDLVEADNSSTAGANEEAGDDVSDVSGDASADAGSGDIGEVRQADSVAGLADRALTAEGDGGLSALPPTDRDLDSLNGDNGSSEPIVAIPPEPTAPTVTTSSDGALDREPDSSPDQPKAPRYLTGWGITAPVSGQDGVEDSGQANRANGIGRVPGNDAFGGIVSMSAQTPEVIPMWDRKNRKSSGGDRLTMDDWYRFEVPFGPYALVHMPKKLGTHAPVRDSMFPPYEKLERYGEEAGFSPADMRALKVAETGRGSMEIAIRAVRAVLMMKNGGEDGDLLRFWMFLLVGRKNMDRIDVLFPHGYFHGVWAPDPSALEAETGFFRLVRVLDDGDLADRIRQPQFGPFGGDQK